MQQFTDSSVLSLDCSLTSSSTIEEAKLPAVARPVLCTPPAPGADRPLSILVPWMGVDEPFEETLASVLRNRPAGSEVLVPHGPDFVDHYDLKDEVRFVPVDNSCSLAALFNSGLAAASGEVVHLIRPGVLVDEGWSDEALAAFQADSKLGSASPHIESRTAKSRADDNHWVRQVIGATSGCAFYLREALHQIVAADGVVGDLHFSDAGFELDLALSLKSIGYQHQVISQRNVETPLVEERMAGVSELDRQRLARRHRKLAPIALRWSRSLQRLGEWLTGWTAIRRGETDRQQAARFAKEDDAHRTRLSSRRDVLKQTGKGSKRSPQFVPTAFSRQAA